MAAFTKDEKELIRIPLDNEQKRAQDMNDVLSTDDMREILKMEDLKAKVAALPEPKAKGTRKAKEKAAKP